MAAVVPDNVMRQKGDGGVEGDVADVEGDGVEAKDGVGQPEGEDCQWAIGLVRTPATEMFKSDG